VSSARGCASLPTGARARWSRSAPPPCRWAWPSRRSEAIPRPGVAADGARSRRAVGRPAGVACPVAAGSGRARRRGLGRLRARLSWPVCVILGAPRLAAARDRACPGADSRLVRRGPGGLRPRLGPYMSCNSRMGNTTPAGPWPGGIREPALRSLQKVSTHEGGSQGLAQNAEYLLAPPSVRVRAPDAQNSQLWSPVAGRRTAGSLCRSAGIVA
jgi:hypothetical protein